MIDNFIKDTFLKLTSRTYPYGYENDVIDDLKKYDLFPEGLKEDIHGNWFLKIGDSKTMFTCHLDTASKDQVAVNHVFSGNMIETDGRSILGADDKAGMTILLHMIRNKVPGLYCFFFGEEVGCVGSGIASKDTEFQKYDKCVAFDRRGTDSIITYQSSKRCCSDDFARSLKDQFKLQGMNYRLDENGIYTDSAEFVEVIPECTNISVGYYSEHTHTEKQDISHLQRLAKAVIGVEWDKLVIKRNPKVTESRYKSNCNNYVSSRYKTYDDYDEYNAGKEKLSRSYSRVNQDSEFEMDQRTISWNGFDDEHFERRKRTRRGNDKNGRKFLSGVNGEIIPMNGNKVDLKSIPDYSSYHVNGGNRYEALKEKLLSPKLSPEEMLVVREYLDKDNPEDAKALAICMNYMCY